MRWRILRLRSGGPDFVRGSADMGIRSVLSVQSFVESDNLGALNMYSTAPDAFTEDDETVGLLRAAHAGIAMQGSRTESNLCAAIVSRDVIVQAKGILMERYKMDHLAAFLLLAKASQHTNRRCSPSARNWPPPAN